jgi:broad specificity phosphatase PhoE
MQGQLDSPLTPAGREHANTSARLLARLGVDRMFASPLGRVRETVAILEGELGLAATFDDRLIEWSAGDWAGERYADLATGWPVEWAAWSADRYHVRAPGGENFIDVADRARSFVADLAPQLERWRPSEDAPIRIAIVAHGFFNRALSGVLLDLEPDEIIRIRQSNNTLIRIMDAGTIRCVDHFTDGEGPIAGLPDDERQRRDLG